jgi:hypothetical protein
MTRPALGPSGSAKRKCSRRSITRTSLFAPAVATPMSTSPRAAELAWSSRRRLPPWSRSEASRSESGCWLGKTLGALTAQIGDASASTVQYRNISPDGRMIGGGRIGESGIRPTSRCGVTVFARGAAQRPILAPSTHFVRSGCHSTFARCARESNGGERGIPRNGFSVLCRFYPLVSNSFRFCHLAQNRFAAVLRL